MLRLAAQWQHHRWARGGGSSGAGSGPEQAASRGRYWFKFIQFYLNDPIMGKDYENMTVQQLKAALREENQSNDMIMG